MPIHRGSQEVIKRYRGSQEILASYRGDQLVWRAGYSFLYDFNFDDLTNLWWAPLSGFDARTHSSAPRSPAFVFNGMLVAPDSTQNSYVYHLLNREADGDMEWEVTLGDVLNTRSNPSSIIIYSDMVCSRRLAVEYGSDGLVVVDLNGTARTELGTRNRSLSPGDVIRIIRSGGQLTFYQNDALWAYVDISSVEGTYKDQPGMQFFGFGMFSKSGTWSSRVADIQISGETSFEEVAWATAALRRMEVPRNIWTEVGAILVNSANTFNMAAFCEWRYATSNTDRLMRVTVNNVVQGTTADEGLNLSLSNIPVGAFQWVRVEMFAETSNSSYRDVLSGGITLSPAV